MITTDANGRQHHFTVTASYVLFIQDEEILLLRRANTGYRDGDYCMPAGHVDPGEHPLNAAVREAQEETAITLNPEDLELVHINHRVCGDHSRVSYFFKVEKWNQEPINAEPEKHDDMQWFDIRNLPENITQNAINGITGYLKNRIYGESQDLANSIF